MLAQLRIRNFAVVESAELSFGPGLNVLTGETGAGKTIVMTALGLLLGERAAPEMVRAGAKEAVVEAIFELEGETAPADAADFINPENPRELIIRRVIADGGRSRLTINDSSATVGALARIGAALVQIYGQHEQQSLLQRESHLRILDRHGGLDAELEQYRSAFEHARAIRGRLDEIERRERDRADLLDVARFRVAELERAALDAGEDEKLAAERTVLANAARLAEAAALAEQALYGGESAAVDAIALCETRLSDAAAIDPELRPTLELIAAARANLEEAARALAAYSARIEADPARLEQIDNRLQELMRVKRKYGGTIESALDALDRSRREIAELEAGEQNRAALAAELAHAVEDLANRANELSERRHRAAAELKRRIEAELRTLGMRNAIFDVRFTRIPADGAEFSTPDGALGPAGCDAVEFLIAPNLGQPPLPLARFASGGELSRVMLAIKRVEAQRRGVATLVFDEVDAGIGGAVGEVVGRKLKELSRFHQVLCVTHLAQIAAFADEHFVVEKEERRGVTRSRVAALETSGRAGEISRMIGGSADNEKFLRAARELLDRARA